MTENELDTPGQPVTATAGGPEPFRALRAGHGDEGFDLTVALPGVLDADPHAT